MLNLEHGISCMTSYTSCTSLRAASFWTNSSVGMTIGCAFERCSERSSALTSAHPLYSNCLLFRPWAVFFFND